MRTQWVFSDNNERGCVVCDAECWCFVLQATVETKLKVTQPQQSEVAPTVAPMEPVTVKEGKGARFNTVVMGKPKPNVQWYREGSLIPNSKDFVVSICLFLCVVFPFLP